MTLTVIRTSKLIVELKTSVALIEGFERMKPSNNAARLRSNRASAKQA